MPLTVWRSLPLWLLYFCLLLWAAMPQGLATKLVTFPGSCIATAASCPSEALTPRSTNADILRLFQTADAAFVANRAKTIADTRDWGHVSGWPLWPPGMIALETLCYWLSPALPVALVLIVLGCGLWASVFLQAAHYCADAGMGRTAALGLPLMLLLSGEFGYYFHTGIFYSESYTTAPFLLGVGLLLRAAHTRNHAVAAWAGLCLALSAYMRAQTDLVMTVTCAAFACCTVGKLLRQERSLRYAALARLFRSSAWLGVLGVALASYYAVTFPYRAAHHMQWITIAESPMWPPTWEYKKDIPPLLEFYITGGGVEGCEVDPALCASIHRQRASDKEMFSRSDYFHFTLRSFACHPLRWLAFKTPYLWNFWMENPNETVVLTFLLPLIFFACLRRRDGPQALLALLMCTTGIGIIGPLLLTHFEARYLYQFRMLILYGAILVVAQTHAAQTKDIK